ncbi:MAG: stage II sporulation protein M [Moorellaceae bacterium]
MEQALLRHLKDNILLYGIVSTAFLGGILSGALMVLVVGEGQQVRLAAYLDNLLHQLVTAGPQPGAVAVQAAVKALKEIGVLWFLGLTVLGGPLIILLLFVKGFILGFTVAFLVQEKALQGVALSLFSILPANLLRVPALFLGGALALSFSLSLMKGSTGFKGGSLGQLVRYSVGMAGLLLVVVGSGWIEAYLVPPLLKVAVNYF